MSADQDKPLETLRGNCLIPAKIRARKEIQHRIFMLLCSLRKMQGVDPAVYPVVEHDCNYDSLQIQTNAEFAALETQSLLGPRLDEIAWKLDTLIDRPQASGAATSPQTAGIPGKRPATRPAPVTGWRSYTRAIAHYSAMMVKPIIAVAAVGVVVVNVVGFTRLRADHTALEDAASQDRLTLQKYTAELNAQRRAQAQQTDPEEIHLQRIGKDGKDGYLRILPDGSTRPVRVTVTAAQTPDAPAPANPDDSGAGTQKQKTNP